MKIKSLDEIFADACLNAAVIAELISTSAHDQKNALSALSAIYAEMQADIIARFARRDASIN